MNIIQKLILWSAVTIIYSISQTEGHAHDEHLHMKITESAFWSSPSLMEFLTDTLGADTTLFASSPILVSYPVPLDSGIGLSPLNWLRQGSYWEDMTLYGGYTMRSLDHFYTVWPGRVPGQAEGLTDESEPWFASLAFPKNITNSFAWGSQQNIIGPQWFNVATGPNTETWPDARNYEYLCLTSQTKANRDKYLAHMLYALGHVLHLNQDTSQPDHVRNDNHKIEEHRYIEKYGYEHYQQNSQWFNPQPHGWLWWRSQGFNKLLDFWDRGHYLGNAQPLNDDAGGATGYKLGLAEVCNGSFLGEDALYREMTYSDLSHNFPFPSRDDSTNFKNIRYKLVEGLNLVGAYDVTTLKDGTPVNRIYLAQAYTGLQVNHHSVMGYLSIANNVYAGAYGNDWIVRASLSINDPKVLQEYHDILIPKAVEYSTGILDYFFRGQLLVFPLGDQAESIPGKANLGIINVSRTNLYGGVFRLFWDDAAGNRTELTGSSFSTPYTSTSSLNDGDETTMEFTIQPNAVQYVLVYQGNIGANNDTALDPIDANIAIAAKSFGRFSWWKMEESSGLRIDASAGELFIPDVQEPPEAAIISTVPGKIGNAVQLAVYGNSQLPYEDAECYSGGPITVTGTATWCGWWKHDGMFDGLTDFEMLFKVDLGGIGQLFLVQSLDGSSLEMFLEGSQNSTIVPLPSSGNWHFFLVELGSDGTWRLQFDNSGPVFTLSGDAPTLPAITGIDILSINFGDGYLTDAFDEIAEFPKILTQTQKDYLYNSGNGRTYPITLPP
jgi:hypothetical protein